MNPERPDPGLRRAVIAFAVIEALVLVPLVLYLLVRRRHR